MEEMQAVWLETNQVRVRTDVPRPRPPEGEALVRVRLAGICATDLELVRGYYPYTGVMGHEFVGEVVEAPAYPAWTGRRVVGEINAACGRCATCRAGRPHHCEQRTVLGIAGRDGIFAEYALLPVVNLHRVPDSVPDEAAVFTEPLAAALEIQEQVQVHPDKRVLVVGAGRLGQLIAQTLALTGCDLHVVARHKKQRELLAARQVRTLGETEVQERKWDLVIEATGSPAGFQLARQAVRPRGTIVLKSTYKAGAAGEENALVNFSALVVDEITVVGSRCGPFLPALRLLEKKLVDPCPLIEARYPLAQAAEALELAAQPGVMKVLLQPQE